MSKHNFISGYETHAEWYKNARETLLASSNPPDWLVDEGKSIKERERLEAALVAADAQLQIDRADETESEFYLRMVKRDAAVRSKMRANKKTPPSKETQELCHARIRLWIQEQDGMTTMDYPEWGIEECRLVSLREAFEMRLWATGEYK